MALTTTAQVMAFLNAPAAQEGWVDALRQAAEACVKSYCNRDFEAGTFTEVYSGRHTRFLALRNRPVTSVTSVHLDQGAYFGQAPPPAVPFDAPTLLTQGVDYALDTEGSADGSSRSGLLLRIGTVWPEVQRYYYPGKLAPEGGPAYGNIQVVYSGGYAVIPQDVQIAVAWVAAFTRTNIPFGSLLGSEKIGDYAYSLSRVSWRDQPLLGTAAQLLSKYRESLW